MSNSAAYSSGSSPSSPEIEPSQLKQQLQEQLIDMCVSRGKAIDSTPSSPNIDYAKLSKFERTVHLPGLEKPSTTDPRPDCCHEMFAINRARYFLKGVLEGRLFDQIPGYKEKLQARFKEVPAEQPIHATDQNSDTDDDPLTEWFSKGVLQGLIDKEDGILPGENEKLELLFQVDPDLLVLWLENYIDLKKRHWTACDEFDRSRARSFDEDENPDGTEGLSGEELSGDTDQDSESSEAEDYDVSMSELSLFGREDYLADHSNRYHPETTVKEHYIEMALARVRGHFKRMKTALEYLQKHQDQSSKIKSFNKQAVEFAELACKFLNSMLGMYGEQDEVPEAIFVAFFEEFATLYPSPKECKGRDTEEVEFQKQFVTAVAKKLGVLIAEPDQNPHTVLVHGN